MYLLNRGMGNSMVTLYVGPRKTKFAAHKELLCRKIPYFEKMFKGPFKEAIEDSAHFPENTVESFDLLLTWLYNGELKPYLSSSTDKKEGHTKTHESWKAVPMYALADMLQSHQLMDQIITRIAASCLEYSVFPPLAFAAYVYQRMTINCSLRKLLSHSVSWIISNNHQRWSDNQICETLAATPELMGDVIRLIRKYKGQVPDPRKLPICSFHLHEAAESCPHV
jgi:BTB/POZ domain